MSLAISPIKSSLFLFAIRGTNIIICYSLTTITSDMIIYDSRNRAIVFFFGNKMCIKYIYMIVYMDHSGKIHILRVSIISIDII